MFGRWRGFGFTFVSNKQCLRLVPRVVNDIPFFFFKALVLGDTTSFTKLKKKNQDHASFNPSSASDLLEDLKQVSCLFHHQ